MYTSYVCRVTLNPPSVHPPQPSSAPRQLLHDSVEYLEENGDSLLKRKSPYILKRQAPHSSKSRRPYILKRSAVYWQAPQVTFTGTGFHTTHPSPPYTHTHMWSCPAPSLPVADSQPSLLPSSFTCRPSDCMSATEARLSSSVRPRNNNKKKKPWASSKPRIYEKLYLFIDSYFISSLQAESILLQDFSGIKGFMIQQVCCLHSLVGSVFVFYGMVQPTDKR